MIHSMMSMKNDNTSKNLRRLKAQKAARAMHKSLIIKYGKAGYSEIQRQRGKKGGKAVIEKLSWNELNRIRIKGGQACHKNLKLKLGVASYGLLQAKRGRKGGQANVQRMTAEEMRKNGQRMAAKQPHDAKVRGGIKASTFLNKRQRPTAQEERIIKTLLQNGFICYQEIFNGETIQYSLSTSEKIIKNKIDDPKNINVWIVHAQISRRNVDFFYKSDNPIVIEATDIRGTPNINYAKALSLLNKLEEIKRYYKNVLPIAIISEQINSESIMKLLENYRIVFYNEDMEAFAKYVNKWINTSDSKEFTEFENLCKRKLIDNIKIKEMNKRGRCGALASSKKHRRGNEQIIENLLDKNGINYKRQFELWHNLGCMRIVDFYVPFVNRPVIIETTELRENTANRDQIINVCSRIESRMNMIKSFYCPKAKYIVVITRKNKLLIQLYPEAEELLTSCDVIVTDKNIHELPKIIMLEEAEHIAQGK